MVQRIAPKYNLVFDFDVGVAIIPKPRPKIPKKLIIAKIIQFYQSFLKNYLKLI